MKGTIQRKHFFAGIIAMALWLVFSGCSLDEGPVNHVAVGGIQLDRASVVLFINTTTPELRNQITLTAAVSPPDASGTVTWGSSNLAVATVDQNGVITAVGEGTAVIGAATGNGGFTAVCTVTVQDMKGADPVLVTGISLDREELQINMAYPYNEVLTAGVTPLDATNKLVTWSTGNQAVATVDQDGKITAVGPGTAVITAAAADGGFTAVCTVHVIAPSIPPTGIAVTTTGGTSVTEDQIISIDRGAEQAFAVTAYRALSYAWTIDAPGQAYIEFKDISGPTAAGASVAIVGKASSGEGTATITATASNTNGDITFSFKVKVTPHAPAAPVVKDGAVTIAVNGKLVIDTKAKTPQEVTDGLTDYRKKTLTATAAGADQLTWAITTGGAFVEFEGGSAAATGGSAAIVSKAPGAAVITVTAENADGSAAFTFNVEVVAEIVLAWSRADDPVSGTGADGAFKNGASGDMHRIAGSPYYFVGRRNLIAIENGAFKMYGAAVANANPGLIIGGTTATSTTNTTLDTHVPGQLDLSKNATFRLTVTYEDVIATGNNLLVVTLNHNNVNFNPSTAAAVSVLWGDFNMGTYNTADQLRTAAPNGPNATVRTARGIAITNPGATAASGTLVTSFNPGASAFLAQTSATNTISGSSYTYDRDRAVASLAQSFIMLQTHGTNYLTITGIRLEQVTAVP